MKTVFAIALILGLLSPACQTTKREKQQGTTFLFYPLRNIYFDQDNKEYYYFDSTRLEWQVTATLPELVVAGLGRSVLLDSVPVPVYRDNASHRLIHGAILYSSPDSVRRQYREDSLASLPKIDTTVAVRKDSVQVKRKSRVGRFLEKIFGKKKKDQDLQD